MPRYFLSGHRTFENRGCEAIVRSTARLLRLNQTGAEVLVPTSDISTDARQWPDAADHGVEFVQFYGPSFAKYWTKLQRWDPTSILKRGVWPFPVPSSLKRQLQSVDCVLAVGGDNYSLDYGFPALIAGVDKAAMDLGIPVVLWGASVGPFDGQPTYRATMSKHLARMAMLGVRESCSMAYLAKLGLGSQLVQMTDPAMVLDAEPPNTGEHWLSEQETPVLGLNLSPFAVGPSDGTSTLDVWAGFVRKVVAELGVHVLLVPHVIPYDGRSANNDLGLLKRLFRLLGDLRESVHLVSNPGNAPQLKWLISRCSVFIGARTHATIAALSSGVPTLSISYSVKSIGLNQDLLGHTRYVINRELCESDALFDRLCALWETRDSVRKMLLGSAADKAQARIQIGLQELSRRVLDV